MKTGLVLEGGACRGIFTSGVLDEFMKRGLKFDYCIGVSAGAGNAMNYKSHQPGRIVSLLTADDSPEYYGLAQARKSRKLLDLDLIYDTLSYDDRIPFDFAAYYNDPMECEYVVSNCETGKADYLREKVLRKRLIAIVKASSSMPGICAPVKIDGKFYLDGGVADAMPVRRAFDRGCDKVVLVTTKPADNLHPTDYSKLKPILSRLYKRRFPNFYECIMNRLPMYFNQLEQILKLEQEGKIFLIRPRECRIHSLERDKEKMREYYTHGITCVDERWDLLMNYLNG